MLRMGRYSRTFELSRTFAEVPAAWEKHDGDVQQQTRIERDRADKRFVVVFMLCAHLIAAICMAMACDFAWR